MYENKVHKKILELATEEVSLRTFQKEYLEKSTKANPIRVQWETLEGNTDYYWMYWDRGAYVGGDAGGSSTKQKEGMFNVQCLFGATEWRTLTLQTVSKFRLAGSNKIYVVK